MAIRTAAITRRAPGSWSSAAGTSACTPPCACRRSSAGAARRNKVEVIVVDPRSYMTYQPFLPEAAAGSLEPRHVVVPLRRVLDRCEVLTGRVESVDHARRVARIAPTRGEPYDLTYEYIVLAAGSIARTLPIPGLAELGIGFKQVEEAIALRNQVLEKLDIATAITDHACSAARC